MAEGAIMYLDPIRYVAMIKTCAGTRESPPKSRLDCMNLMFKDVEEGYAINVPAGTRLDVVNRGEAATRVIVGRVRMLVVPILLKCR